MFISKKNERPGAAMPRRFPMAGRLCAPAPAAGRRSGTGRALCHVHGVADAFPVLFLFPDAPRPMLVLTAMILNRLLASRAPGDPDTMPATPGWRLAKSSGRSVWRDLWPCRSVAAIVALHSRL